MNLVSPQVLKRPPGSLFDPLAGLRVSGPSASLDLRRLFFRVWSSRLVGSSNFSGGSGLWLTPLSDRTEPSGSKPADRTKRIEHNKLVVFWTFCFDLRTSSSSGRLFESGLVLSSRALRLLLLWSSSLIFKSWRPKKLIIDLLLGQYLFC